MDNTFYALSIPHLQNNSTLPGNARSDNPDAYAGWSRGTSPGSDTGTKPERQNRNVSTGLTYSSTNNAASNLACGADKTPGSAGQSPGPLPGYSPTDLTRGLNVPADNIGNNRILATGVDTLEVGYCIKEYLLTQGQLDWIAQAKLDAQSTPEDNDLGVVGINGVSLKVNRTGAQRYEYIMSNGDIIVKFAPRAQSGRYYPELHIRYKSEYLWRVGWLKATKQVRDWLNTWAVIIEDKVSRADICVDLGMSIPELNMAQIVSYARGRSKEGGIHYGEHYQGRVISGYSIGKGDMMCRIYDKTREILKSGKQWFQDIWRQNGWIAGMSVTRVECQYRRNVLRELQTNSLKDLELQLGDLWQYAVAKWLTIRDISSHKNNRRWKVSGWWQTVQKACIGAVTGIIRSKQIKPKYERLAAQVRGLLVSMASLKRCAMPFIPAKVAIEHLKGWVDGEIFGDPCLSVSVNNRFYANASLKY